VLTYDFADEKIDTGGWGERIDVKALCGKVRLQHVLSLPGSQPIKESCNAEITM
jgi:hypothetical protein